MALAHESYVMESSENNLESLDTFHLVHTWHDILRNRRKQLAAMGAVALLAVAGWADSACAAPPPGSADPGTDPCAPNPSICAPITPPASWNEPAKWPNDPSGPVQPAGNAGNPDVAAAQQYAHNLMPQYGWGGAQQWNCLVPLWDNESGWRWNAWNPIDVVENGVDLGHTTSTASR